MRNLHQIQQQFAQHGPLECPVDHKIPQKGTTSTKLSLRNEAQMELSHPSENIQNINMSIMQRLTSISLECIRTKRGTCIKFIKGP